MSTDPIRLDGSLGGGQILRSALTLSLLTGKPFEIEHIRAKRKKPGLQPQHLSCVRAAQAISGAQTKGAEVGSLTLAFEPGPVRAGDYLLDIGTAGATSLLFHSICFPLSHASGPSKLKLRGGTHVSMSPPFHYLSLVWLPAMRELGYDIELELNAAGYYPEGGGEVTATIRPAGPSRGLDRRNRGTLREVTVLSTVSNLPFDIADRQSGRALHKLRENGIQAEGENLPLKAPRSKGTMALTLATFEHGRAGFSSIGERGKPAETVGEEAATAFTRFMERGGAVDEHLADQLLLPLAIAAAGLGGREKSVSHFSTENVTEHLVTNAQVIARFLDVEIAIFGEPGSEGTVRVAAKDDGLLNAVRAQKAREDGA